MPAMALMAVGTLVSAYGQYEAANSQKKALRAQQTQADMEAQNQRLEQVRQGRIARAQVLQMGENQGAGGSSSVTTAASGATMQANANIGYLNEQQDIGHQIVSAKTQQINYQQVADIGSGLFKLGSVFGSAGIGMPKGNS